MSPKQGRPFEEKGKYGRVEIRTSEAEEKMLEFCAAQTGKRKADIIRQGIAEIYAQLTNEVEEEQGELTKLKVSIACPYCDANNRIEVVDYEVSCSSYDTGENRMGEQIEHCIESEDFKCKSCGKEFCFEGQVWEYPVGTLECKEIRCFPNE